MGTMNEDTVVIPWPPTVHTAVFVVDNALAALAKSIREDLLTGKADEDKVRDRQKLEDALRILSLTT